MSMQNFISAYNKKQNLLEEVREADSLLREEMKKNLPELIDNRIIRVSIDRKVLERYR